MYYVMNETSALNILKKLKAKYIINTIDNHVYLKMKIFRFDYTRATSMSDHVNEFSKIISGLKSLKVTLDDKDNAILLFN